MKLSKKTTTSKKILYANYIMVAILIVALIVCTFTSRDCSNLAIATSAAFVELGVHTMVYARKAKAENCVKIAESVFNKIAKQYGADIAIQVFQSSIQD